MTKVILLTFGVLGWAWFEMSGGADFQPGQNGVTLLAAAPVVQTERETPIKPVVERVARADTTSAPLTGLTPPKLEQVIAASVVVEQAPVIAPAQEQVAALDNPIVQTDAVIEVAAPKVDYRQVTGSRVNLRGGPGTGFDVVTQLLRGEEVEILESEGDGWVKLRALDGNDIGWMSESFLKAVN